MNDVLPVGSVIELNNKKEKYIIIGKKVNIKEKEYDYCGVIYPYGLLIEQQSIYYFDDKDIKSLFSVGNINYE